MDKRKQDQSQFLMLAALGYSLTTFAIIFGSISAPMGVLSLSLVMFLMVLPFSAIASMAIARLNGVHFHWAAMIFFVCWILSTVYLQFKIFEQAAWSV